MMEGGLILKFLFILRTVSAVLTPGRKNSVISGFILFYRPLLLCIFLIQPNFNGSNAFGAMKKCLRQW